MKPIKLLLVDDDEDDRELISAVVNECSDPVEIKELADGSYVLDYLDSCKEHQLPHLIILDLNMPRKNGFEVIEEVKAHVKYYTIPLFVLTTSSTGKEKNTALQLGATDFLTKPLRFEEWVEKLCTVIQNKQAI